MSREESNLGFRALSAKGEIAFNANHSTPAKNTKGIILIALDWCSTNRSSSESSYAETAVSDQREITLRKTAVAQR